MLPVQTASTLDVVELWPLKKMVGFYGPVFNDAPGVLPLCVGMG
jgi:hypothetical protein